MDQRTRQSRIRHNIRLLFVLGVLAVVIAACTPPNLVDPVSPEEASATIDEVLGTTNNLGEGLGSDIAGQSLMSFPGPTFGVPLAAPFQKMMNRRLVHGFLESTGLGAIAPQVEHILLERGEFEWDPELFDWVLTATSDDLFYRWNFDDGLGVMALRAAELMADWDATSATTEVVDQFGDRYEVPTGMAASLSVDSTEVASAALTASWFDIAPCGPILEPSSLALDASFGVGTTLDVTANLTISENGTDTIATDGSTTLSDASDSVAFSWDVTFTGDLTRTDCFISDFSVSEIDLAFGISSSSGGNSESIDLAMTISNIDMNSGDFDVDGSLDISGVEAATFSGRYDDADDDGVYGDNVNITYADGSTETLEELTNRLEELPTEPGFGPVGRQR